jgi:hypothetical protein
MLFFLQACGCHGAHNLVGVVSVEHLGRPNGVYDGICISLLVEVDSLVLESSEYQWVKPEPDMQLTLLERLEKCAKLFLK